MGRSPFQWRRFVCLPMVAVLPVSLAADDTAAMLRTSSGDVQLNHSPAPPSSALFSGDLIETGKQSLARIEANGSVADINPETLVEFQGHELVLDHGSVSVNTSRGLRVRAGCLIITPVNADWTRYDVIDVDGKVTVSAIKNDVYMNSRSTNLERVAKSGHSDRAMVREGQQKSRADKCGGAENPSSGPITAAGAMLNSSQARIIGVAAIGALTCWALCRSDDPVSPKAP